MTDFKSIVRPTILQLLEHTPTPARVPDRAITVHLDANENPFNAPHNRYSNEGTEELKGILSNMKGIWPHCIALCNGTDEAIDYLFRIFCNPGKDNVIAISPTARAYSKYALLNDVTCRKVLLNEQFQISADDILAHCDEFTKIIFLCSPNNPTGNLLDKQEMKNLCSQFSGVVVVDEAYHEFSRSESMVRSISQHHNLIVLNTLSKAFASADLRLSIIYAVPEIIRYIHLVTPHHHINRWTQEQSLDILQRRYDVSKWINQLLDERRKVMSAIRLLPICEAVYPTDANFFLAKFKNAEQVYHILLDAGISVHFCHYPLCENCLRITIGLPYENTLLIGALRRIKA